MSNQIIANLVDTLSRRENKIETATEKFRSLIKELNQNLKEDISTKETIQKVKIFAYNQYYSYNTGYSSYDKIFGEFPLKIIDGEVFLSSLCVTIQDERHHAYGALR